MTKEPLVPSVLDVKSVGIDVSHDLNCSQTKSIAQCLYDQENLSSEKEEAEKNNEIEKR